MNADFPRREKNPDLKLVCPRPVPQQSSPNITDRCLSGDFEVELHDRGPQATCGDCGFTFAVDRLVQVGQRLVIPIICPVCTDSFLIQHLGQSVYACSGCGNMWAERNYKNGFREIASRREVVTPIVCPECETTDEIIFVEYDEDKDRYRFHCGHCNLGWWETHENYRRKVVGHYRRRKR